MIYPKVLIGTITFDDKDYVLDRFVERVKEFTYPDFEFLMIDSSKNDKYYKRIKKLGINVLKSKHQKDTRANCSKARNMLVEEFLKSDAEYLFHLEQDVIPRKDIIEELIKWKKKIVGGWYYINQGSTAKRACVFKGFLPISGPEDYQGKAMALQPYRFDEMSQKRLMKIYLGSLGVTLIHRDIFEKHKLRFWWAPELTWHDDTGFYHDLDIRGIDVYIDTDLLCPHFQSSWALDEKNKRTSKSRIEVEKFKKIQE